MKKPVSVPQTALSRSVKLLRGGASILAKEVAGRVRGTLGGETAEEREKAKLDTMLSQAERLVSTLGDLKGAAMKAGQILSLEMSDMLPKEVLDVLRRLHDSGTPGLTPAEVEAILRRELGEQRFSELEDLTPEPIAAASIGQVHGARIAGRDVVLKIQFPGIADTVDADLSVVGKLATAIMKVQGKEMDLSGFFEEMARGLKAEMDYVREADALIAYKEIFAADSRFVIPDVLRDYSTQRVLTLSRVEGVRLKDWMASGPSRADLDYFGAVILDMVLREFFDHGLVQTDPNFGNFLYQPDAAGGARLVLLDFGAVQRYDVTFRNEYRKLLRLALTADRDEVLDFAVQLELMDARESHAVRTMIGELIEAVARMFDENDQPFAFGNLDFLEELRRLVMEIARDVRYSAPPKSFAFLNRKLSGMYHLLKEARCSVDLRPFVARVLSPDDQAAG